MKTLILFMAVTALPAQAGTVSNSMATATLSKPAAEPSFEGKSSQKPVAQVPVQPRTTAAPVQAVATARAGQMPPKVIQVADDDEGLEPVDADLIRANRQLRKESHYPLQWLKKNGNSRGRMTKAEQKCFEIQRAEFEKAMDVDGVQQILKLRKIKRMTFSLRTNNSSPEATFNWNVPRGKDAFGGNYMVVKFSMSGGRCRITTAKNLVTGAIASIAPAQRPVARQELAAEEEEEEQQEAQEQSPAQPAEAQARPVEVQPPSAYRPQEQVTTMPTPAPAKPEQPEEASQPPTAEQVREHIEAVKLMDDEDDQPAEQDSATLPAGADGEGGGGR